jgi:hypothetical protein
MRALIAVAVAALFCACASSQPPASPVLRMWGPATARIIVPIDAPPCALWTVEQAWEFLSPAVPMTTELGWPHSPSVGEIVVDWSKPAPGALGITTAWGERPLWRESRYVMRAVVQIDRCQVRLAAHEFSHALGAVNVEAPGRLMTRVFDDGGWALSPLERAILSRTLRH